MLLKNCCVVLVFVVNCEVFSSLFLFFIISNNSDSGGHLLPETLVRKFLGKKENGIMSSGVTQNNEWAVAMENRSEACCRIPIRDN